jgi:predicted dehydrogenase
MVRFGIVGFGLHARKRLMPAFAQTRNARVTALSQRDPDRARASAAEFGIPLAFTSAEELCGAREVDAVFVATPNVAHLHDTVTALDARKPVLCEKPMAMNAVECEAMIEASCKTGSLLGVAHVFRFARVVEAMRESVQRGDIGVPLLARGEFSFPGIGHARKWIHDRATGGGVVNDVGIHCLDSLRWILKDEPEKVQALMTSDAHSCDVESAGTLNLRFRNGALVNIVASMRAPYRTLLEVVGDGGRLTCQHALALADAGPLELHRPGESAKSELLDNGDAFVRMIEDFAAAVETGGSFRVPAEEGWRNQRIIDAAYESGRTDRSIRLSNDGPLH